MYLVAVMDWWSRNVLAWEISNTMDRKRHANPRANVQRSSGSVPEIHQSLSQNALTSSRARVDFGSRAAHSTTQHEPHRSGLKSALASYYVTMPQRSDDVVLTGVAEKSIDPPRHLAHSPGSVRRGPHFGHPPSESCHAHEAQIEDPRLSLYP